MFYGLSKFLKNLLPKRLFYRALLIVAVPVIILQIIITIQKELADKLVSKVGDSNYGRISLITNLLSSVSKEIELPPSVFFPKPKVHSSVIKITPLKEPRFDVDLNIFEKLTRRAFGNRRKMLRQSLKEFGGSKLLKLANIKDNLRAQDLSTSEFCKLSKLFAKTNWYYYDLKKVINSLRLISLFLLSRSAFKILRTWFEASSRLLLITI